MELAVEAVLQPPQDSPAGSSLDSALQQLALHFLGGGLSSGAGGAPPPGPGEEPRGRNWAALSQAPSLVSCPGAALLLVPLRSSAPVCSAPLPSCSASRTGEADRAKQQEEPRDRSV